VQPKDHFGTKNQGELEDHFGIEGVLVSFQKVNNPWRCIQILNHKNGHTLWIWSLEIKVIPMGSLTIL